MSVWLCYWLIRKAWIDKARNEQVSQNEAEIKCQCEEIVLVGCARVESRMKEYRPVFFSML